MSPEERYSRAGSKHGKTAPSAPAGFIGSLYGVRVYEVSDETMTELLEKCGAKGLEPAKAMVWVDRSTTPGRVDRELACGRLAFLTINGMKLPIRKASPPGSDDDSGSIAGEVE